MSQQYQALPLNGEDDQEEKQNPAYMGETFGHTSPQRSSLGEVKDATEPAKKPQLLLTKLPSYQAVHRETMRRTKEPPLPLDKVIERIRILPKALKFLIIAISTGLPFLLFALVAELKYKDAMLGPPDLNATVWDLALFLLICWASFFVILAMSEALATMISAACQLSTHTRRYAPLVMTVCYRLTLVVWTIWAHQVNCWIYIATDEIGVEDPLKNHNYVYYTRQVFLFLAAVSIIIVLQGIVLQLIAIQYVQGFIGPRAQQAANALRTLQSLDLLINPKEKHNNSLLDRFARIFKFRRLDHFARIMDGTADEQQHEDFAAKVWDSISCGQGDIITFENIRVRLENHGQDVDEGLMLFNELDRDWNGRVNRSEMEALIYDIAKKLQKRAVALRGIKALLWKLEIILTMLMMGLIVFAYTVFFQSDVVNSLGSLWTGVIALSFAFGGAVSEFVSSCVFVFAKHPFDVGDTIEVKDNQLFVHEIYLTHANFVQILDDGTKGKYLQISHAAIGAEVIINWTRSEDQMPSSGVSKPH